MSDEDKKTEIIKIPQGWELKTLDEITLQKVGLKRGPFGGALKKSFFVESGFKVYEQKNAIYKNLNIGNYYISAEKFEELKGFAVKPGDLIVSCSGTIGKIAEISKEAEPGVINQAY